MPAGSGPNVAQFSGVSVGSSEVVLAAIQGNFSNPDGFGNLLSYVVNYAASAAQTLTLRIRQGGLTGTIVAAATIAPVIAAAGTFQYAFQAQDASAFANLQQQGVYSLTAQSTIAGPGTANGLVELETIAPVQ
jgi:hypothetical protein